MSSLSSVANLVESQSLNAVIAGFSFASAIAWMDVVRWLIGKISTGNMNRTTGTYYLLTALLTTILAVLVFIIIKSFAKNVTIKEPQTVYAVTGAAL
jgi:hypothetical protein